MHSAHEHPGVVARVLARDLLLERLTAKLSEHPSVAAAWLAGSFGRNAADAWSDLDRHVAVRDDQFDQFVAERETLFATFGRIIVHQDVPANAPPGGAFSLVIYPGVLEVDWTFVPAERASRPPDTVVLFNRVGIPLAAPAAPLTAEALNEATERRLTFFWAIAPAALKYAGRGNTAGAVRLIGTMAQALDDVRRAAPSSRGTPALPTPPELGERIDALDCVWVIRGLCIAMDDVYPQIEAMRIPTPRAALEEMLALADLVEQARGEKRRQTGSPR